MNKKSIEDILIDFRDRFDASTVEIFSENRNIEGNKYMLWFVISSKIKNGGTETEVVGQSYSLEGALAMLHKSAMQIRKPDIKKRKRIDFQGIEGVVEYD